MTRTMVRRELVVRSYGSNMAAAETKLSFDLAVDSVLDSLEPKFILKEEQRLALHSITHQKGRFSLASNRISVALHTSSGIIDTIG